MSNGKALALRVLSAAGMFCFAMVSRSADVGVKGAVSVEKLLQSGYEVKAAYVANTGFSGHEAHVIILQKGAAVYQCTSSNIGKAEYSNAYSCVPVIDAAE